MMKRVALIGMLAIAVAAVFLYVDRFDPGNEYHRGSNYLEVCNGEFEIVFKPASEWTASGYVRNADYLNDGPFALFSGTYGLAWGDIAVELAWHSGHSSAASLSAEARKVVSEYGDAALYLDEHTLSFFAVAADRKIERALQSLKVGDLVTLRGFDAEIISSRYQGQPIAVDLPRVICVEAVVNNGRLCR